MSKAFQEFSPSNCCHWCGYRFLFPHFSRFTFPVVKLLDLAQDWQTLSDNRNPLATAVMAHLKANQTRTDKGERLKWKLSLTRRLYQQGYQRQDVINLFKFIDWPMSLPKPLEQEFWREIRQLEEETVLPSW